ncbi:unnamed protein product [Somion occarium]|uniref:Integrase catalytic domain-containing protein n=1 Tax=Somion occarium TaxID=3059160 RepID=A0ABP1CR09_9APHY
MTSPSGQLSAIARKKADGLYILDVSIEPSPSALYTRITDDDVTSDDNGDLYAFQTVAKPTSVSKASLETWHHRLGHINYDYVLKMFRNGLAQGMEIVGSTTPKMEVCAPCVKGKQTRTIIPSTSSVKSPHVNYRVHSDNCGPMQTPSHLGHLYFNTHIDAHSHHVHVDLIKAKSETHSCAVNYISHTELVTAQPLVYYRSDGGGKYESAQLTAYFKTKGIHHEKTNAYTPQENGVAECMNRTLVEMARTMLEDAGLPKSLWGDAIQYAAYIINRTPTRSLPNNRTPHEVHTGNIPSVAHLRIFGCKAYAHVPTEKRRKLDSKSFECMFIGFAENQKAYKLLHHPSDRVHTSRDVRFDEGEDSKITRVEIEPEAPTEDNHEKSPKTPASSAHSTCPTVEEVTDESEVNAMLEEVPDDKSEDEVDVPPPLPVQCAPLRRSTRRTKEPIRDDDSHFKVSSYNWTAKKERRWTELSLDQDPVGNSDQQANCMTLTDEPQTYEEAISGPNSQDWLAACAEELKVFVEKELFDEVQRPRNRRVVGCKWVFRHKYGPDGQIERYKARLVAQGFTQIHGVDYNETFAPVTKFNSI